MDALQQDIRLLQQAAKEKTKKKLTKADREQQAYNYLRNKFRK